MVFGHKLLATIDPSSEDEAKGGVYATEYVLLACTVTAVNYMKAWNPEHARLGHHVSSPLCFQSCK